MCIDYLDVNLAYTKDNYLTPFIDQIIDDCVGCEIFSFMHGFYVYNQINIHPEDKYKIKFICPWGTFACRKLPSILNNIGENFQRAMDYASIT